MKYYIHIIVLILTSSNIFLLNFSAASIATTRHNLSVTGPGEIRSEQALNLCVFCHTSTHTAKSNAPSWNRESGIAVYKLYDSSTLYSKPGQPDGASKLCLSCHDGTVALGKIRTEGFAISMLNTIGGKLPPNDPSNLGVDLSDDHPISFDPRVAVIRNPELKNPEPFDNVRYDENGKLQCTTCHDPHKDNFEKFLVKDNRNSGICKSCHVIKNYTFSVHNLSSKLFATNPGSKISQENRRHLTIADNSCGNCHRTHGAAGKERLLVNSSEDKLCLECHGGNSQEKNIEREILKPYSHNTFDYKEIHQPNENIFATSVHVECADCHNPHQTRTSESQPPFVKGVNTGVSGMDIQGNFIGEAIYEYQICLKCHGDDRYFIPSPINRQIKTSNSRIAFNPANASYHPVIGHRNGDLSPSLKPEARNSQLIYCTDCHSSDTALNSTAPKGPHGSAFPFILKYRYVTSGRNNYSEKNYDLCFSCHDPNMIFSELPNGFILHKQHVQKNRTPCSVCHDPHGSPDNPGLINFDLNTVSGSAKGLLKLEITGSEGVCFLNCHKVEHSPKKYKR